MKTQALQRIMRIIKAQAETTEDLIALIQDSNGINTTVNFSKDSYDIDEADGVIEVSKESGTDWIDIENIVSVSA